MKTLIMLFLLIGTLTSYAQDSKKVASVDIITTAVCDMCVRTIEDNLIYEKGMKKVQVVLATNTIHAEYDPRKTTPEAIRVAVTKLGYYADGIAGDAKAFAELPACCQKEGCGQMKEEH